MGFPRRPREGGIDIPGIAELAYQFRGSGGPRNREQEGEHRLAVLFPGVLLERPAKGLVFHLALWRQTVRERGEEGERIIRVPLVLRQVQRHATDVSPLRV